MSNLRYTACIRAEENFCSIRWTSDKSFSWGVVVDSLYNNNNSTSMGVQQLYMGSATGGQCNDDDFVAIDQGSQEGSGPGEDRFCGESLLDNNVIICK